MADLKRGYVEGETAFVSGYWRSPMCTHEYSVEVGRDGRWSRVDLVAYGTWTVYGPEEESEARFQLGDERAAEIDQFARDLFEVV